MPGLNPFAVTGDPFAPPDAPGSPPVGALGGRLSPGIILVDCLFAFPVLPGQDPAANDNQTVTTVPLDSLGNPVLDPATGQNQPPSVFGVAGYSFGLYACRYAVPPGFKGTILATLTTGPNAGQTSSQPVDFSLAVDISPLSISAGKPTANLLDIGQMLVGGSDGCIYVPVTASATDTAAPVPSSDLTHNPVEMKAEGGVQLAASDWQPAEWLTVASGPAKGVYARLCLSALDGTALIAGAYRVSVRLNGLPVFRTPGILVVKRGTGSGLSVPAVPSAPLPLSPSQYQSLSALLTTQQSAVTQQLGNIMTSLKQSALPQFGEALAIPQSSAGTPIPLPALPIADYLIECPVIVSARTDYAYSNGSYPRILKTTYRNPEASTVPWTVVAVSGETFATTDGGAGLPQIVMQPGESRTMETTSATVAKQV